MLDDLARRLEERQIDGTINIIGGSALSLVDYDRGLTSDIDADLKTRAAILEVASDVAAAHDLESTWLNDDASAAYIPRYGKPVEWMTVYRSEFVTIQVASREALLVMKLGAARRGRDDEDVAFLASQLGITSLDEAEALYEDYFPGEVLPEKGQRMLSAILNGALLPKPALTRNAAADPPGWHLARPDSR